MEGDQIPQIQHQGQKGPSLITRTKRSMLDPVWRSNEPHQVLCSSPSDSGQFPAFSANSKLTLTSHTSTVSSDATVKSFWPTIILVLPSQTELRLSLKELASWLRSMGSARSRGHPICDLRHIPQGRFAGQASGKSQPTSEGNAYSGIGNSNTSGANVYPELTEIQGLIVFDAATDNWSIQTKKDDSAHSDVRQSTSVT